jgi:hypothetical protein
VLMAKVDTVSAVSARHGGAALLLATEFFL